MRIQEEKIELHRKVHRTICVGDITFLAARPLTYVIFCHFFHLRTLLQLFKIFKSFKPCLKLNGNFFCGFMMTHLSYISFTRCICS